MSFFAELIILPLFTEAILYGLYFATLIYCLRWLIFDDEGWKRRRHISWVMLSMTTILFLLLTVDLALDLRVAIGPALQADVLGYERQDLIVSAISISTRLLFDAVLIYRCWVVYAKSWRVNCLPLILWICCFIISIFLIYYNTILAYTTDTNAAFRASAQIYKILIMFYSCNIAINIYATSAIIYRILKVRKGNKGGTSTDLLTICRALVESGALYTLTSALVLTSVAIDVEFSFERKIFRVLSGPINCSMAGISFNLILIRVGQGRTSPKYSHSDSQTANNVLTTLQFYTPPFTSAELSVVVADEEERMVEKKYTTTDRLPRSPDTEGLS